MAKTKLTESDKTMIKKLHAKGYSYHQISEKYNISYSWVQKIVKGFNSKGGNLDKSKVFDLHEKGLTPIEISHKLGVSRTWIYMILKGTDKQKRVVRNEYSGYF